METSLGDILRSFKTLSEQSISGTLEKFNIKPTQEKPSKDEMLTYFKDIIIGETNGFVQNFMGTVKPSIAKELEISESEISDYIHKHNLSTTLSKLSKELIDEIFKILGLDREMDGSSESEEQTKLSKEEKIPRIEEEILLQGLFKMLHRLAGDVLKSYCEDYKISYSDDPTLLEDTANRLMNAMYDLENVDLPPPPPPQSTPTTQPVESNSKNGKSPEKPTTKKTGKAPAKKPAAEKKKATKETNGDTEMSADESKESDQDETKPPPPPTKKSSKKPAAEKKTSATKASTASTSAPPTSSITTRERRATNGTTTTTTTTSKPDESSIVSGVSGKRVRKPVTPLVPPTTTTTITKKESTSKAAKGKQQTTTAATTGKKKKLYDVKDDDSDSSDQDDMQLSDDSDSDFLRAGGGGNYSNNDDVEIDKHGNRIHGRNPFGGYYINNKYQSPPISKIQRGVTEENLRSYFNLDDLKEYCKIHNLPRNQTKTKICKIILQYLGGTYVEKKKKPAKKKQKTTSKKSKETGTTEEDEEIEESNKSTAEKVEETTTA
eukprot:gene6210-7732_t